MLTICHRSASVLCVLNSQHLYYVATDSSHARTQLRNTEKFLTNINDVLSKITKAALFQSRKWLFTHDSQVSCICYVERILLGGNGVETKIASSTYMQLCFSLVCITRMEQNFISKIPLLMEENVVCLEVISSISDFFIQK